MLPLTLSIVSHGHDLLLRRLLSQLNAAPTLHGVAVVVTLNRPDESFDPTPYDALDLRVVRNPEPKGFGANHNAAFALCATPRFAILNPDLALLREEPFTRLLERLDADPACALVAPVVRATDGTREDSVRANLTPWSLVARHVGGHRDALSPTDDDASRVPFFWLAGMCLVVDSALFARIGGFDEGFFLYCEDYDLCARIVLAGRSIAVEPTAEIVHDARRDSRRSSRHLRWHLASLARVWTSAAFWRITLRGAGR